MASLLPLVVVLALWLSMAAAGMEERTEVYLAEGTQHYLDSSYTVFLGA
jgi:hypothetical protein